MCCVKFHDCSLFKVRALLISQDPKNTPCYIDNNNASFTRVWWAGLRPPANLAAQYNTPPANQFGWDALTGGVYFLRSLVQPGLAVTYCAVGNAMCASPKVTSFVGGNVLYLFLQNSRDCLDLFAQTMPVNHSVVSVPTNRTSPWPNVTLLCRFTATTATIRNGPTVSVLMDGFAHIVDTPVVAIDAAQQQVSCRTPPWNNTVSLFNASTTVVSVAVSVSLIYRYRAVDPMSALKSATSATYNLPFPAVALTYYPIADPALNTYASILANSDLLLNTSASFNMSLNLLNVLCSDCIAVVGVATCWRDCMNDLHGAAQLDRCAVCTGGRSNRYANADLNCVGTCNGAFAPTIPATPVSTCLALPPRAVLPILPAWPAVATPPPPTATYAIVPAAGGVTVQVVVGKQQTCAVWATLNGLVPVTPVGPMPAQGNNVTVWYILTAQLPQWFLFFVPHLSVSILWPFICLSVRMSVVVGTLFM